MRDATVTGIKGDEVSVPERQGGAESEESSADML